MRRPRPGQGERDCLLRPLAERRRLRRVPSRGEGAHHRGFVRLSGLARGARVADMGCGSGAFTGLLAARGLQVSGIDIAPNWWRSAASKYPGIELLRATRRTCRSTRKLRRRAAERPRAPFSRSAPACRGSRPRAQARRAFRRLRPEPDESVHVALSRPASPFYSRIGVTENERPMLAAAGASVPQGGFPRAHGLSRGAPYRYVASKRTRALLPVYNFIDGAVFDLAPMRRLRPFVLTSGEKL